jgi:hypothetical protein
VVTLQFAVALRIIGRSKDVGPFCHSRMSSRKSISGLSQAAASSAMPVHSNSPWCRGVSTASRYYNPNSRRRSSRRRAAPDRWQQRPQRGQGGRGMAPLPRSVATQKTCGGYWRRLRASPLARRCAAKLPSRPESPRLRGSPSTLSAPRQEEFVSL